MTAFLKNRKVQLAALVLIVFSFLAAPNGERTGDRLQYAVPVIGLVCAFEFREAGAYLGRYAAGLAAVHAFKNALPGTGIGQRPDGGTHGFPSGHTYSASYGASYLARQCSKRVPYIGTIGVIGAAFTGASRVEAEKHNVWQVLFGMLFAVFFEQFFRPVRWFGSAMMSASSGPSTRPTYATMRAPRH